MLRPAIFFAQPTTDFW